MSAIMAGAVVLGGVIGGIANAYGAKQAADAQRRAGKITEQQYQQIMDALNKVESPKFQEPLSKEEIRNLTLVVPDLPERIMEEAPQTIPFIKSTQPALLEHIAESRPQMARMIEEETPQLVRAEGEAAQGDRYDLPGGDEEVRRRAADGLEGQHQLQPRPGSLRPEGEGSLAHEEGALDPGSISQDRPEPDEARRARQVTAV